MDRRDEMASYGGGYINRLPEVEIDQAAMTATFYVDDGEEKNPPLPHILHLKWEVCGTCNGQGKHVNPSIDCHGISQEEFDDDPQFEEEYFSGTYDVECSECHGRTTSLAIDESKTKREALKAAQDWWDEEDAYHRECEAERRMGA